MNVDFEVLSSAVAKVATASNDGLVAGKFDVATPTPSKRRAVRRRSSASNAKQFLELAHKSWTFAQEDLPSVAQRRRSIRKSTESKLAEIGHKSWPSASRTGTSNETDKSKTPSVIPEEDEEELSPTSLFKKRLGKTKILPARSKTQVDISSKQNNGTVKQLLLLPPRSKSRPRRASIGSCTAAKEPKDIGDEEAGTKQEESAPPEPKRQGSLKRRSSLSILSKPRANKTDVANDETKLPVPPIAPPKTNHSPKMNRKKMVRRNTIGSCSNEEGTESPVGANLVTRSPKQSRRASLCKLNQNGKGTVRFELDHKNRIKRRVNYIRAQNSRTDSRALWWSEDDLDRIYQRENRVYDKFSNDRNYKRAVRKLWGNCSKAANVPLGPDAVARVAGAPSRGLEVDILETVRDRRARIIANVLDAQDTLQDFEPTIRAKVLGARYKNLCRAASRFARKMGEGDALEAANVYSN
ncbi:expressed unknown protein [Seminavis robusta]|uniref:Uncharacterized protein n=1 Tax=Seminavis robusta TaxID=568900 RepID=A0A9N8E2A3_9STRA|nr:expressed unknown protein [Seminavis robusta]|eukprot:Sro581_g170330.1 n/a (468) ;mRNA; r:37815-39218